MSNEFAPNFTEVTRNDVTLPIVVKEVKKGKDYEGLKYPAIEVTETNLEQVIKYFGADTIVSWVKTQVQQLGQAATKKCATWNEETDELLSIGWDKVKQNLENLTARSESIPELQDKIKELLEEADALMASLGDDVDMTDIAKLKELRNAIAKNKAERVQLEAAIEDKRRERKPKVKTAEPAAA